MVSLLFATAPPAGRIREAKMDPISQQGWLYYHVTGTVLVQTGQGVLHTVSMNGLYVVGDITIYDGVDNTGAVIAVLSLATAVSISIQPISMLYDAKFVTGLYIEYDQAVEADLTVTHQ